MTSSRVGASIVACLRSPLTARAVYVNCGMMVSWFYDSRASVPRNAAGRVRVHRLDDPDRQRLRAHLSEPGSVT